MACTCFRWPEANYETIEKKCYSSVVRTGSEVKRAAVAIDTIGQRRRAATRRSCMIDYLSTVKEVYTYRVEAS